MSSEVASCDILIGGPPCQPFSVGGAQQGKYDGRDMVPFFIKCIEKHKPSLALMENVENLAGKRHRKYLDTVVCDIRKLGYTVEWRVMNCADYGIAQRRKRIVLVAHLGGFQFPEPHQKAPLTVGDVLKKESFAATTANTNPSLVLTKKMDEYIAKYEAKSKCINPRDLDPERPARTLTCRNLHGATSDMIRIKLANGQRRQLTVEEAARIQTFPADYFEGIGRADAMTMIGNSVPPALSVLLGKQVQEYMSLHAAAIARTHLLHSAASRIGEAPEIMLSGVSAKRIFPCFTDDLDQVSTHDSQPTAGTASSGPNPKKHKK